MTNRFIRIFLIAVLSVFLTGCIGDEDKSSEELAEEYRAEVLVNQQYAEEQFSQGNYWEAFKGAVSAGVSYVASKAIDIYKYILGSKGSYRVEESRLRLHKKSIGSVAENFAQKSKHIAIDHFDGGKKIPLGEMVLKYAMAGAQNNGTVYKQRLVATIQLHESAYTKPQLSLLCNTNGTVDFGIGQVNTVSWEGICRGMVNMDIITTATNLCRQYRANPDSFIVDGKKVGFNTFTIKYFERHRNLNETALTRLPNSPFNPIVNSRCTLRHLEEDFKIAQRSYKCENLYKISRGKFACTPQTMQYDYTAVALMVYGGVNYKMLASGVRYGNQTFDDYMAEFRAAYAALFREPPPF